MSTDAMTSVDVAEGRRLCEAATAGPWEVDPDLRIESDRGYWITDVIDNNGSRVNADNAAFIVWARNNLPALLTAHEAALNALRFYADHERWDGFQRETRNDASTQWTDFDEDRGERARALLGDRA